MTGPIKRVHKGYLVRELGDDEDKLRRNRIATLKMDYEMVRKAHPEAKLKPYDELTKGEREAHEEIFNSTSRFFAKLGQAIHDGTELPDPTKDH